MYVLKALTFNLMMKLMNSYLCVFHTCNNDSPFVICYCILSLPLSLSLFLVPVLILIKTIVIRIGSQRTLAGTSSQKSQTACKCVHTFMVACYHHSHSFIAGISFENAILPFTASRIFI